MKTLLGMDSDPKQLSPLTLAFLGDAVFSMMVREKLVCEANRPVGELHRISLTSVSAQAQAKAVKALLEADFFTEEELQVWKRGRNATTSHTPKNATSQDYHFATGLESLFGYLYLSGKTARLYEIFQRISA